MKGTNRQYRLEQLRLREAEGTLTEREQAELLAIFAELDAEEAEALKPAKEKGQRLQKEKAELEEIASQLQDIVSDLTILPNQTENHLNGQDRLLILLPQGQEHLTTLM